jgi:hypothetical protein
MTRRASPRSPFRCEEPAAPEDRLNPPEGGTPNEDSKRKPAIPSFAAALNPTCSEFRVYAGQNGPASLWNRKIKGRSRLRRKTG